MGKSPAFHNISRGARKDFNRRKGTDWGTAGVQEDFPAILISIDFPVCSKFLDLYSKDFSSLHLNPCEICVSTALPKRSTVLLPSVGRITSFVPKPPVFQTLALDLTQVSFDGFGLFLREDREGSSLVTVQAKLWLFSPWHHLSFITSLLIPVPATSGAVGDDNSDSAGQSGDLPLLTPLCNHLLCN